MKLLLINILFILIAGCSNLGSKSPTCENNGTIDFMYINIPCENCIIIVEAIMKSNPDIFDYDIIINQDNHIMINYCYNSNNISQLMIEKSILDYGFLINQPLTDKELNSLTQRYCNSK